MLKSRKRKFVLMSAAAHDEMPSREAIKTEIHKREAQRSRLDAAAAAAR
jgi:hypothetical protein